MAITRLKEAGLDYIRLTENEKDEVEQMFGLGRIIMLNDCQGQDMSKPGGMLGFYGRKTRHVFQGVRQDWGMLQVTGYVCREWFYELLRLKSSPTRIDIQVTLEVQGDVGAYLKSCEYASINQKPVDGRKWKTTSIAEDGRTQTVYIGSRQSEWFGRIYDKFAESRKEQYKNCVRFEIELKGQAASEFWTILQGSGGGIGMLATMVKQWYARHGIDISIDGMHEITANLPPREPPTEDKKLAWFKKQVAKSVAFVVQGGYWYPAFQALFGEALSRFEMDGILLSHALCEGM